MEENAPRLHKTTSHFFEDTNKCCGEYAYIKELDGTLECYAISYWNEETRDFNDVFTPIKQEIPADYPQELMHDLSKRLKDNTILRNSGNPRGGGQFRPI